MMTFEEFDKYLNSIKAVYDLTSDLYSLYNIDIVDNSVISNIETNCVKLLELIFNDSFETISYYCYDLNFGKESNKLKDGWDIQDVTDNKQQNYILNSNKALYDYLTRNEEEDGEKH